VFFHKKLLDVIYKKTGIFAYAEPVFFENNINVVRKSDVKLFVRLGKHGGGGGGGEF
jgi:hypothetical protein